MKTALIVVFSSLVCLASLGLVLKYILAVRKQKDLIQKKKKELQAFEQELEKLKTSS